MTPRNRPAAFWLISIFLSLSAVMLLLGQTTALFAYEFAVSLGLQESVSEVSPFGVEVNRAFALGDTAVYIPLIITSLIGLYQQRRWAIVVTAAVMGISAYWSTTVLAMLVFLDGAPGYSLVPGPHYWLFLFVYMAIGVWGLGYLAICGERLQSNV